MQTLVLPARRLGWADEEWAALLLTEAYTGHAPYHASGNHNDLDRLQRWMRLLIRYALRVGCVYASPEGKAVAVWVPDKAAALSWGQVLRGGRWKELFALGLAPTYGLLLWQHDLDFWRHEVLPVPHHYLLALGVRPTEQGRGEGRNLLRASLAAVGGRYLPCYAVAPTLAGVYFAQRLGFEIAAFTELPAPGPASPAAVPCWALVRPAAGI